MFSCIRKTTKTNSLHTGVQEFYIWPLRQENGHFTEDVTSALNIVLISFRELTKYRVLKLELTLITFSVKLFELKPKLTKLFLFSIYSLFSES